MSDVISKLESLYFVEKLVAEFNGYYLFSNYSLVHIYIIWRCTQLIYMSELLLFIYSL